MKLFWVCTTLAKAALIDVRDTDPDGPAQIQKVVTVQGIPLLHNNPKVVGSLEGCANFYLEFNKCWRFLSLRLFHDGRSDMKYELSILNNIQGNPPVFQTVELVGETQLDFESSAGIWDFGSTKQFILKIHVPEEREPPSAALPAVEDSPIGAHGSGFVEIKANIFGRLWSFFLRFTTEVLRFCLCPVGMFVGNYFTWRLVLMSFLKSIGDAIDMGANGVEWLQNQFPDFMLRMLHFLWTSLVSVFRNAKEAADADWKIVLMSLLKYISSAIDMGANGVHWFQNHFPDFAVRVLHFLLASFVSVFRNAKEAAEVLYYVVTPSMEDMQRAFTAINYWENTVDENNALKLQNQASKRRISHLHRLNRHLRQGQTALERQVGRAQMMLQRQVARTAAAQQTLDAAVTCQICMDEEHHKNTALIPCGHVFCEHCVPHLYTDMSKKRTINYRFFPMRMC